MPTHYSCTWGLEICKKLYRYLSYLLYYDSFTYMWEFKMLLSHWLK